MLKPAWDIGGDGWQSADGEFGAEAVCILPTRYQLFMLIMLGMQLKTIHGKLPSESRSFFLVRPAGNTMEIGPVEEYDQFFADVPPASVSLSSSSRGRCAGQLTHPPYPIANNSVHRSVRSA